MIMVFTTIFMFVIIYVIRMLDPSNEVVTFHTDQGFLYRIINNLIH